MRQPSTYMKEVTGNLWNDFSKRFRNKNSINVYFGDISECMDICEKDITDFHKEDADHYYQYLMQKVKDRKIQLVTVKKKIKEIHKFSEFITEKKKEYLIPDSFDNYFYQYAVQYFKDEELVTIPTLQDVDKIMDAAKDDLMVYTILTIVQRIGLRSTEICNLKPDHIVADPNGVFIILRREKDEQLRFVPEDVVQILELYLEKREKKEYLFYNKWGRKLNTQYLHAKMKMLTEKAKTPSYSLMDLRKMCGAVLFAYGAEPSQVARQMGITTMHINRYDNVTYERNLLKEINDLVHLKVLAPDGTEE